jgi:hypothetical protein
VNGAAIFGVRLEQIERRFPGLFNMRIGSVEVLPVALMDATRFSLELAHLGSGQVRLKAGTEALGELLGTDWLSDLEAQWSIRLRNTGPETAIFSGVSLEPAENAAFFAANQRGGFEGIPGAAVADAVLALEYVVHEE